jgi:hypothetical protein
MVGGTRKEAKLNEVLVYRQTPGSTKQEIIKVDVAAIRKNQKPDFLLQAYDVIDVPEASMFSPGRLGPTIFSALTGGMASAISNTGMYLPQRVIY